MNLMRMNEAADISAENGIVSAQAQTTLAATPHRTAESRLVDPTPTMAPVIVCVVLTGMPPYVAKNIVAAPAVSAANPPTGFSRVSLDPIVCTIRQPPDNVPKEIAL